MGILGRMARERFVMPGRQKSRLLHACHSCRKASYPAGQTREEVPQSACSASSSATPGIRGTLQIQMHSVRTRGQPRDIERLWKEFISDPSQWWDNRLAKRNAKYPDFKHRHTKEGLWMDSWSNPRWVNSELIAIAVGETQLDDGPNCQVHHGALGDDCRGMPRGTTRGRVREGVISIPSDIVPFIKEGGELDMLHNFGQQGIPVPSSLYVNFLQRCMKRRDLPLGKQIHHHIVQSEVQPNIFLSNNLINMYLKCGRVVDARQVFDKLVKKDVVSWNSMIGGYAQHGHVKEAFTFFCQMRSKGLEPNRVTYLSILKAFTVLNTLEMGKEVHAELIKAGYQSDLYVGTALVNMYAKCGSIRDAQLVFDKMSKRDIVSWNTMIGSHARHGHCEEAFQLFRQMQQLSLKPDQITYMSILNACSSPTALERGQEVHAHIIDSGFCSNVCVGTALVNMYAKCGSIKDARVVFDNLVEQNVILYTALIEGYAQHGHCEEAMELFCQMQQVGLKPDQITYLSILNACACPTALKRGMEVHAHISYAGFQNSVPVGNALISMYSKCGSIRDAQLVFDEMVIRDVISWTAMIGGLALYGCGQAALQLFEQMKKERVRPDSLTFVNVLSACSHAGLVDEGRHYFNTMLQDHGFLPTTVHYGCLVDLLGRAGHLVEAENAIKSMPLKADAAIWVTLLGACRLHGNVALAERVADFSLKIEPQNVAAYVLLSNVYAEAGMWDSVVKVRNLMKERGVKKQPGRSWIEVAKKVHSFVVGDRSHPEAEEIYSELKSLTEKMRRAGYVPDTRLVMHEVDEEQKEEAVCHHSEKLAIVYGLLKTPSGTPIRISKNLRICTDCHTATKLITKIVGREIIARDASRFHHFKDGLCSCCDYW